MSDPSNSQQGYGFFGGQPPPQGGQFAPQNPNTGFPQTNFQPPVQFPPPDNAEDDEEEGEGESEYEEGEYEEGGEDLTNQAFSNYGNHPRQEHQSPPKKLGFEPPPMDQKKLGKLNGNFGFSHTQGVHALPYTSPPPRQFPPTPNNIPQFQAPSTNNLSVNPNVYQSPQERPTFLPPQQNIAPTPAISNTSFTKITTPGFEQAPQVRTGEPSSLPRPIHDTFNEEVEQPDTNLLFSRITTGSQVNMSHVQSSASFIRSTIQCAPNTPALLKKYALPFGVTLHPFAEEEISTVSLGFTEVIRCYNCRSYINPFVTFLDRGYKWKCNLCKTINDVPKCYFSKLDDYGCRVDLKKRKELRYGSVEFIAPKRYNTRLAYQPTSFIFVIDVSYQNVVSGAVKIICETIEECVKKMPSGSRTKIGIVTYDKSIHFYNLDPKNEEPKMLVVGELDESLLPLPKHLVGTWMDSKNLIRKVLKMIPTKIFHENHVTQNAYFSAVTSAARLIHKTGGKIISFVGSLPCVGKMKLQNRDNVRLYGGEDFERKIMQPLSNVYKDLALEMTKDCICIDVFCMADSYMDVATIGCFPKYTSGKLVKYNAFDARTDGFKLKRDIVKSCKWVMGYDGVMRVRVSQGLQVKGFYGNFFIKGHNLLALPYVDSEKGFAIELEHSSNYIATQNCSIQMAILYTTPEGERRIRVHNITLPITSSLSDLYKSTDIYAVVDLLAKKLMDDIPKSSIEQSKKMLFETAGKCLQTYRNDVRSASMQRYNHLVLADNVRLLPLFTLGLMKSRLFNDAVETRVDRKMAFVHKIMTMTTPEIALLLHPALYDVSNCFEKGKDEDEEEELTPRLHPLTRRSINFEGGCYVMNTMEKIYVLVGEKLKEEKMEEFTELQDFLNQRMDVDVEEDYEFVGDKLVKRVYQLIIMEREKYGYIVVEVVTPKSAKSEGFFMRLIEDKISQSKYGNSYDRFIVNLHNFVVNQ